MISKYLCLHKVVAVAAVIYPMLFEVGVPVATAKGGKLLHLLMC